MKKPIDIYPFYYILVLICCFLIAGCSSTYQRVDHPHAYLKIESLYPPSGSVVDKNTIVEARLSLYVNEEKIDYDRLVFSPAFTALTQGQVYYFGWPGRDRDFQLESPEGIFTLEYPLDTVWDSDVIERPFRMYFHLVDHKFDGTRLLIESTAEIIYKRAEDIE